MSDRTREPQYQRCIELCDRHGLATLGLMTNQVWHDDPRRLVFILARYKFVAKMLSGAGRVLEVGCGDAFATRIVLQEVAEITAVDFDPVMVKDARRRTDNRWPVDLRVHDILDGPVAGPFDAAYALDLLEHIPADQEDLFLRHLRDSLVPGGILILGVPSAESQQHASPQSKAGHVNCKDHVQLRALTSRHFNHVFIFSMNDEVVHTGFYPMAHYLFALCCAKKR